MDALVALACTLPPSAAFVAGAFVWLQRERDRRLNDARVTEIMENAANLRAIDVTLDAALQDVGQLTKRLVDAEQQISRLTDRIHG